MSNKKAVAGDPENVPCYNLTIITFSSIFQNQEYQKQSQNKRARIRILALIMYEIQK